MHYRYLFIAFIISTLLFSCRTVTSIITEGEDWMLLGENKVNHLREKDIVRVTTQHTFTALRLYATKRDVQLQSLKVYLINGDMFQPSIDPTIKAGERSRIIELAADGRQIDRIELHYRSRGRIFTERGVVQVLAQRYNPNGRY